MGQALCKRTLNVVEKMWASHDDKMRLFLAKADEAGSETDRQRYNNFIMKHKYTY